MKETTKIPPYQQPLCYWQEIMQTTSHSSTLLENHLKIVVRMFSGCTDEGVSDAIPWHCIKIAFLPVHSIEICIFIHTGLSDWRTLKSQKVANICALFQLYKISANFHLGRKVVVLLCIQSALDSLCHCPLEQEIKHLLTYSRLPSILLFFCF